MRRLLGCGVLPGFCGLLAFSCVTTAVSGQVKQGQTGAQSGAGQSTTPARPLGAQVQNQLLLKQELQQQQQQLPRIPLQQSQSGLIGGGGTTLPSASGYLGSPAQNPLATNPLYNSFNNPFNNPFNNNPFANNSYFPNSPYPGYPGSAFNPYNPYLRYPWNYSTPYSPFGYDPYQLPFAANYNPYLPYAQNYVNPAFGSAYNYNWGFTS